MNFDNVLDQQDRIKWVERLASTYFGDANLDGMFDTSDMGEFGTADLVLAFSAGEYEQGPRAARSVPEPHAWGFLARAPWFARRRRR
jgi:hypothetical protein